MNCNIQIILIAITSKVEFLRYILVGSILNAAGYLAYLALIYIGLGYKLSATIVYFISIILGYMINRRYVFNSNKPIGQSILIYLAMILSGYILNISGLIFLVDNLTLSAQVAPLVMLILITFYFFVFNKIFVY
jgi:putative flippase GtrA